MGMVITGLGRSAKLAQGIAKAGGWKLVNAIESQFPDGEDYIRFKGSLRGADLVVVNTLYPPNDELMACLIAADAARSLGARRLVLVAPYLAYMRQDKRFQPGEAISSRTIAGLISEKFDRLITVDPHLHRYKSLGEIYSIPARVLHADVPVADWIRKRLRNPVLVGPDRESRQWVSKVAKLCDAPFTVMQKKRFTSTHVRSSGLDAKTVRGRDVVVLDDIISSGHTMAGVLQQAAELGAASITGIGVHGLFARGAKLMLTATGARIVTCNAVPGPTARIDLAPTIAEALKKESHDAP
ncbi:MAG: ribose-phosphate diphosphokinase [Planctomycetes bacterium]|nr:ribose-phosphate diphosphokinase [Planctomycetota bacterium]